jgi:Flp pilus assembly protein TadD
MGYVWGMVPAVLPEVSLMTAGPALSPAAAAAELHDAGRLGEAEAAYRQLLADRPDDPDLAVALADVLADAGRGDEAVALYRRVIDAAPDDAETAEAHDGLAAVLQDAGDVDGAVVASRRAAELRGDADDAYRLGYTLDRMNRADDAHAAYALAAELRPTFAEAHAKVGTYLLRRNRPAEAVDRFARAAVADENIAEIHCNLAHARRLAGDEDGALKAVRRAIDLKPDMAVAHNVLGTILQDRRRPTEALASFRRALQLKPDLVDAVNNIGGILERIGRVNDAGAEYERAVAMAPSVPAFHVNLGMNRLLRGDLTGGWREFDWRRLDRTNPASRPFRQPLWDGAFLGGRTILLTAEQGAGDTIQFLRYAALAAGRGGRVIVECQPSLAELARGVAGVAEVVAHGAGPLPPFDVHCPLMTLPGVFNTTLQTVPATVPYVVADGAKSAAWAGRLPPVDGRRRVGLAWAGNPSHANDRVRSMKPDRLAPLAAAANVDWVSLQKPPAVAPPAGLKLLDLTADLHDWSDTAALIAQLDLVITVDTAVAHLAAAMGKPTWILLPAVPDWRWMLGRPDSPWYPTARLFRQPEPGDWGRAIKAIVAALAG